jgi:hypothetical protein
MVRTRQIAVDTNVDLEKQDGPCLTENAGPYIREYVVEWLK